MTNTIEVLMEDAVFVPAVIKKYVTNRDVRLLTKIGRAIEALHREAPKAAVLAEYPDRLHTSCVLASFTLRDMLRAIGMPAAVVPCSLAITSENEGVVTNLLMVGDRSLPRTPNVFNGHLVVRVGNLLIDPTSGQAGRAWNLWYKGLICAVAHRPLRWTDLGTSRYRDCSIPEGWSGLWSRVRRSPGLLARRSAELSRAILGSSGCNGNQFVWRSAISKDSFHPPAVGQ